MSPLWVSTSEGDSWGTALRGESWLVSWSGDRASLLSSSKDELSPPAPFGESVTEQKYFQCSEISGTVLWFAEWKIKPFSQLLWPEEKNSDIQDFLTICNSQIQIWRLGNSDDSITRLKVLQSFKTCYVLTYLLYNFCNCCVVYFLMGQWCNL